MSATALSFPINGTHERVGWAPKKYRYWYDAIIDELLVDPSLSQKDIANRIGRHPVTVGLIMNSDLFRARYEQRRGAQSEALREKMNDRLTRTAISSLEVIEEKLRTKRDTIPLPELADLADKTLARLGYGPKTVAQPTVVVNNAQVVAPVTPEQLAASRQKILDLQASRVESATPSRDANPAVGSSEQGKDDVS